MAAMKVAVLSLDRLQSLQPILKLLGTRQREEGVTPGHYDTFQERLGVDPGASAASPLSARSEGRLVVAARRDDPRYSVRSLTRPLIAAAPRRRHPHAGASSSGRGASALSVFACTAPVSSILTSTSCVGSKVCGLPSMAMASWVAVMV